MSHELTDEQKLAGDLGLHLCEEIWNGISRLRLAGDEFRPAHDEEFRELGYSDDDNLTLVLRRESDGEFFEVEIDCLVTRVRSKAGAS